MSEDGSEPNETGPERRWTSDDVVTGDSKGAESGDEANEIYPSSSSSATFDNNTYEDFTDEEAEERIAALDAEGLTAALEAEATVRSIAGLKRALKQATVLGLSDDIVSPKKELLERLSQGKRKVVQAMSKSDVSSEEKEEALVAAIAAYETERSVRDNAGMGVEPEDGDAMPTTSSSLPTLTLSLDRALEAAKVAVAKLRGEPELAEQLETAVDVCDRGAIDDLLGRAAAVKFDGRVVDQAKALKASCEAAEAALESAIVDGHGGKLEEAIQAARGVHENFHSPMQVKADRQLEKLLSEDENKKSGEHQELEAALEVAVEWTNLEAIGELLARAEAVEDAESFMATSDVVKKAKELVAKTESIAKVLQTALTSRNSKTLRSALTLAKALPKLKLPVLATAEKELGRIEREEPVVAMLKKALKSKKVFELTAAINAAEELDKTLYEEADAEQERAEKAKEREKKLKAARERRNSMGSFNEGTEEGGSIGSPKSTKSPKSPTGSSASKMRKSSSSLRGTEETLSEKKDSQEGGTEQPKSRAEIAMEKHVTRAAAGRLKEERVVRYVPFRPKELEKCKELRKAVSRLQDDLAKAMKLCAYQKTIPELLEECRKLDINTRPIARGAGLVSRCAHANRLMERALAEADDGKGNGGSRDLEPLRNSLRYAARVHPRFIDNSEPLVQRVVDRLQWMLELHRRLRRTENATVAVAHAPLYYATVDSEEGLATSGEGRDRLLLRRSSSKNLGVERRGSFSNNDGSLSRGPPRRASSFNNDRRSSLQRRLSGDEKRRDSSFNNNLNGGDRRPSLERRRSGSFSDLPGGADGAKRTSSNARRRSLKSDPALHASAMDKVLEFTVEDAKAYLGEGDPVVVGAEHVLKRRALLREGLGWLLRVQEEHDSADPATAAPLLQGARNAASKLAAHESTPEAELCASKLIEACLNNDVDAFHALLPSFDAMYSSSNAKNPSIAELRALYRVKGRQSEGGQEIEEEKAGAETVADWSSSSSGSVVSHFELMHYAAMHGSVEVATLLVQKYGKQLLKKKDEHGRTPLHVAAMRGRENFLHAALLLKGDLLPDGDARPRSGNDWAVSVARSISPDELTKLKAVLLADVDNNGMNALHQACLNGRPLTAESIVQTFGPEKLMDSTDGQGRTPVQCAKERGHGGLAADLKLLAHAMTTNAGS